MKQTPWPFPPSAVRLGIRSGMRRAGVERRNAMDWGPGGGRGSLFPIYAKLAKACGQWCMGQQFWFATVTVAVFLGVVKTLVQSNAFSFDMQEQQWVMAWTRCYQVHLSRRGNAGGGSPPGHPLVGDSWIKRPQGGGVSPSEPCSCGNFPLGCSNDPTHRGSLNQRLRRQVPSRCQLQCGPS